MTPKDRIALIVAVGLIVWGIIAIGGVVWRNKSFSEGGAEFFTAIGGALVAMLVTHFATRSNNGNNGNGKR